MRKILPINFDWRFCPSFEPAFTDPDYDDSGWETVHIPHTVREVPFNNFDEKVYQFKSCYRKKLTSEELGDPENQLYIRFAGVMSRTEVFLNGRLLGEHKGGYTPFRINLTPAVKYSKAGDREKNSLTIMVDSTERSDTPPFGRMLDYLTFGGIYREVSLESLAPFHIEETLVTSADVLTENAELRVKLLLRNDSREKVKLKIAGALLREETLVRGFVSDYSAYPGSTETEIISRVGKADLWDTESPRLYHLELKLYRNEKLLDTKRVRFGFREAVFSEYGFFLNGRSLKIRGLNRHQAFPYVGYAMPKSAQYRDADILKEELGVNGVRLSHYPQSDHFMDRCDELGLLVFDELPGWQHIGNEEWKETALDNIREMIWKDGNHPSVIIWGVRINESRDDDEFYSRTNALAREMDGTRQTGGVRCITGSSLLEDVYTYNDFSHNGKNPGILPKRKVTKSKKPYLIAEHNGHMFPTKKYDDEAHRIDHLKRHLQVLNDIAGDKLVAGGFGWCMFDYNTHKDFGSGDRICYHGVMDMFRIPKHAARAYSSQQEKRPTLHIASPMEIGEFEGSMLGDVYVLTNCDHVELYKNDTFIQRFFPRKDLYPHLTHPPVIIDDFIGEQINEEQFSPKDGARIKRILIEASRRGPDLSLKDKLIMGGLFLKYRMNRLNAEDLYLKYFGGWGHEASVYTIKGYRDGKCVLIRQKGQVREPKLLLEPDSTRLIETETYDVTRCVVRLVDEYGDDIIYANDAFNLSTEGPIEIIGPKVFALTGGSTGFWVKSLGTGGEAKIILTSERFGSIESEISVERGGTAERPATLSKS